MLCIMEKATDVAQQSSFIDVLGEPENSPIRKVVDRIAKETSWDNPIVQAELAAPQKGFIAWFKRKVLSRDDAKHCTSKLHLQQHKV